MTITYRSIDHTDVPAYALANSIGFGQDQRPGHAERLEQLADLSRFTAALDGEEFVGTAGVFDFEMSIPGGSLPCAGVTWVSVKPTHRRRGVLTSMMRIQLDEIRAKGEAIAALWASEAPIYGRFGYGLAAEGVELQIARPRSRLRHVPAFSGRCRFVTRDEALACWPALYEEVRLTRPGMISRNATWWNLRHLPEDDSGQHSGGSGYSGSFRVQYEEARQVRGYVRYRIKTQYSAGSPTSELLIVELIAASDAAYSALWSFVFGIDLIESIHVPWGSVDEPLLHMLEDPRRLIRRPQDTLFVRIIDVPRALSARKYAMAGRLVFAVRDRFCDWTEGTYVLESGPNGGQCYRAEGQQPDLTFDAEALGAIYLGGTNPAQLARAGRVTGESAAIEQARLMFGWDPAPWIPEIF